MDTDFRMRIYESGIIRHDEKIAVHGQFESTDDGFIAGSENIRHIFSVTLRIKKIILADDAKIDAGTKRLAVADKNRNFYIAVARHFIDCIVQVYEQVLTNRIMPFRSVQRNQCNRSFYFE
jgi:hypothetical protein